MRHLKNWWHATLFDLERSLVGALEWVVTVGFPLVGIALAVLLVVVLLMWADG
jgi:hypothetical protein